jgi:hypothetical protein
MNSINIQVRLFLISITALCLISVAAFARAESGELLWEDRFDLTGGFDKAEAVVVQGTQLFVFGVGQVPSVNGIEDFDWIVRAYDRLSGALLWQDVVDGGLDIAERARAIAVQGRYLVAVGSAGGDGDGDYWVRAYDSHTGQLRWEDLIVNPYGSESANDVVIKGQRAFVVGTHVSVYNVKNGRILWEDIDGSGQAIAVSGKRLFTAGSRAGDFLVRAYNGMTGEPLWEDLSDLSGGEDSAAALVTLGNRVIAAGYAGDFPNRDFVVRAYHPSSGALIWEDRYDTGSNDYADAIAVSGRSVYVVGSVRPSGSSDFAVRAYDRNTGALQWNDTFDFAGGNDAARAVTIWGGLVYVGGFLQEAGFTESGFVVRAYDSKTGNLAWMDQLIEPQSSNIEEIAALGGQVYAVGTGFYLDFLVRAYTAN